MSDEPRTEAGRALLEAVAPAPTDAADPAEEWVAEAHARRSEYAALIIRAIEEEAAHLDVDGLDAAWAEAEAAAQAAMPGSSLRVGHWWREGYAAWATPSEYGTPDELSVSTAHADSPAAALRALAAKLRHDERDAAAEVEFLKRIGPTP
jgi:hypothetical protein